MLNQNYVLPFPQKLNYKLQHCVTLELCAKLKENDLNRPTFYIIKMNRYTNPTWFHIFTHTVCADLQGHIPCLCSVTSRSLVGILATDMRLTNFSSFSCLSHTASSEQRSQLPADNDITSCSLLTTVSKTPTEQSNRLHLNVMSREGGNSSFCGDGQLIFIQHESFLNHSTSKATRYDTLLL